MMLYPAIAILITLANLTAVAAEETGTLWDWAKNKYDQESSKVVPLPSQLRWAVDKFDNLKLLPYSPDEPVRFILGDVVGFLHVYEQRAQAFDEIWTSEFLEGAVGGIFVADMDKDDILDILVYTESGRIHILDVQDYHTLWSNPPNEYKSITAMALHNVDEDEQLELLFCGDGMLIVYDGLDRFEESRSQQSNVEATDIIVGDVDGDGADEIVLNDGFVYDARFTDLEWQSPQTFGKRLRLLDLDDDGIVEVIGEFEDRGLRIFDIDQRRQKSTRR